MINAGRLGVLVQPVATSAAKINTRNLSEALVVLPHVYSKMDFAMLVSKKSTFAQTFLDDFDRTITLMKKDGSMDRTVANILKQTGK